MSKTFRYPGLLSSALDMKTNSGKKKESSALKLHVFVKFRETKNVIYEKLEKNANKNISVEKVAYFLLLCLDIDNNSWSLTLKNSCF